MVELRKRKIGQESPQKNAKDSKSSQDSKDSKSSQDSQQQLMESVKAGTKSTAIKPASKTPLKSSGISISKSVLFKLIFFSILVIAVPIGTFYATLSSYGSTYAGIWAAVSANLILILYILVAYYEDD